MSEHTPQTHEKSAEMHVSKKEAEKHQERIQDKIEKNAEKSRSRSHETGTIRHEVKEQAISGAEYHKPQSEQRQQKPLRTRKDKELAFDTVMREVRSNLSSTERTFSKIIHQPVVEKASETIGKTVARPSGVIGAAIAAAAGLFSVYSVARFAGFQLSGSEMPLLLAGGFVIGLATEFIYKSVISISSKKIRG